MIIRCLEADHTVTVAGPYGDAKDLSQYRMMGKSRCMYGESCEEGQYGESGIGTKIQHRM